MPKKTGTGRAGAQRNRPKVQKNIELVNRKEEPRKAVTVSEEIEEVEEAVEEARAVAAPSEERRTAARRSKAATAVAETAEREEERKSEESPTPKGSAAARMAARRLAAQRAQQRNAATLITAEHFAYVKRDLITIGILASIMFAAIIILYFTIGRA